MNENEIIQKNYRLIENHHVKSQEALETLQRDISDQASKAEETITLLKQ